MSIANNLFHDYSDKFVITYLDDIHVYNHICEEHVKHIELVLLRLGQNMWYGKLSKCIFGVQEIEYLGFILKFVI